MAGSSASASGVVGPAGAGDVLGPPALSNGVATGEPPGRGDRGPGFPRFGGKRSRRLRFDLDARH